MISLMSVIILSASSIVMTNGMDCSIGSQNFIEQLVSRCPGLLDSSDKEYCCLDTQGKFYCCNIFDFATTYLTYIIIGIVIFIVLSLALSVICCFCCPCCYCYKRRNI